MVAAQRGQPTNIGYKSPESQIPPVLINFIQRLEERH